MNRTLLDTDILSDFLRGRDANVQRRAASYLGEHGRLTLSALTVFEVVRGRYQARQVERAAQFLAWSQTAEVLAFDARCAQVAGEIAGALLRTGVPVGVADVLIAATAIGNKPAPAKPTIRGSSGLTASGWETRPSKSCLGDTRSRSSARADG